MPLPHSRLEGLGARNAEAHWFRQDFCWIAHDHFLAMQDRSDENGERLERKSCEFQKKNSSRTFTDIIIK